MHLDHRFRSAFAILIAVAGIAGSLTIAWLWSSTANYADSQMRPVGVSASYVPPPGPIYLENDSYYWLSYAQRIAHGEDWRIRYTNMDNFPTGREVHWSQSVSWSMVVFGKIRAVFTHETLATAIEKASVAINSLLYALAAVCLFLAFAPRFGTLPSALLLAFLGSVGDVGWTFQSLRPGHQIFHVVFGGTSVVSLILGGMGLTARREISRERWPLFQTLQTVNPRAARRWFLLAGIATGMGLWVSATIESFFIYPMIGVIIVLLLLVPPARVIAEDLLVQPDLWRLWGWTAGATAFVFYLIEYFPHHMAMRIEVNHPVYDIAMVGAGETLRLLTMIRWGGHRASPALIIRTALWLMLAALPILLIACGPLAWHSMRDPQMLRLHNFIQEFFTYNNFIQTDRLKHFFNLYGVVPFISLLTPLFLLRRDLTVPQVTWLWSTFAISCSFMAVSYVQIRWMGFYAAAVCLSALVAAHFAFSLVPKEHFLRRDTAVVVLTLILLVQPTEFFRRQIADLLNDLRGANLENEMVTPILNKRTAYALKASPSCPKAIIADPGLAPSIGYFAGIPCMTSFYWENLEGLHNAVRFLAAKDPDAAHELAVRTGATHVIIPPGVILPSYFYYIANGHYDQADAQNTFAAKLLSGKAPLWIQPDTVLNFITTSTYSYRGTPVNNRLETFRIQD